MKCLDCHKNKIEYIIYFDWSKNKEHLIIDTKGSYCVCFLCALDKKLSDRRFREVYTYKELNFWEKLFWRAL